METNLNQQGNQASVQEVDLDIDSWLGAPGADAIVTPNSGDDKDTEPAKNNIFSKNETDLSFLDGEESSEDGEEKVSEFDDNASRRFLLRRVRFLPG